jgi:uncharacterized protein
LPVTDHLLSQRQIIEPRSGTAFLMQAGQTLTVTDLEGEQVSDLMAYRAGDTREHLSSGNSLDFAGTMFLTAGHTLYSSRGNPMLKIVHDEVGRHDFTLAPCSAPMFRLLYGHTEPHRGCHGNLAAALAAYGIGPDEIPTAFNIFMHVAADPATGAITVLPPLSLPGQTIVFRASMDLVIGLTACSAGQSNNFAFKPIGWQIDPPSDH